MMQRSQRIWGLPRRPRAFLPPHALAGPALLCLLAGCSGGGEPADVVVRNARIYTVDAGRPWAEAVAVRGERIAWVGSDSEAQSQIGPRTRVVDAGGRLLLPGFVDSHNHIRSGSDPDILQLGGTRTLREIQEKVRGFAGRRPDLAWIEAEGWNYSAIPGGRLPAARDLEGLTGGRPAFLISYDVHTVWMNREGLERFGIRRAVERTPFGEVVRDGRGEPTGLLTDFATLGLSKEGEAALAQVLPSRTDERLYRSLQESLKSALRFGITTIVEPQADPEDLPIFERARSEGALRSRLHVAMFLKPGASDEALAAFDDARRRFADDRLRVSAIKLYIDDVIEPRTAALLEPYAGAQASGDRGRLLYEPEEFAALVTRLDKLGHQLLIHATGDRGIRTALDAIERARAENGPRDARHQIVHVELLTPEDAPRFKGLGVVACMQPRHCAPDISARWAESVGPARWPRAWTFRNLKEAGAVLAFSSDWNVAEMDPLAGIYTALTRRGLDGEPSGGWVPEQTVDLETALRAYTLDGAYANFVEGSRGSVAPGKYADLILLSDDLFRLPPEKIKDARVVWVMLGGREELSRL
jgi:hypothetical protein